MKRLAPKIAVLFYLAVVLYHPMVVVTHIGMHSLKMASHQNVHLHEHEGHAHGENQAETGLLHTHGEPEISDTENILVQMVFQCLVPTSPVLPNLTALKAENSFNYSHSLLAYYPKRHSPPPQV